MDMFISTLQCLYLDMMVVIASSGFLDLVVMEEKIENCRKNGKIQGAIIVSKNPLPDLQKIRKRKQMLPQ